ncbi:MAG: class II histone deacetylase [Actinobacteria bacterium]|nr:MAG: class II histone deacetylase [Actinomycetota bacterium]
MSKADTGFVYDERCELHDNGSMLLDPRVQRWLDVPHAERPERLKRTYQVLERSGVLERLERVPAREAAREELELVHTAAHVDAVHAASLRGGVHWVGPEARASEHSWTAALLAVGGLLEAVDRVVAGELGNAFACLRPPGHHASADRAMGFCLFNAVAVAARHLQRRHGLERVAILDWDVHHGNGTQEIFYDDPSVLFVSLHQDELYPKGSGTIAQRGVGTTVNVPLPAGTGDDGYRLAFDEVVAPALERFGPEFLLVSAGQDPAASDTHGRMSVTTEGFRSLAERARTLFDGRLVAFLEGGYSLDHLPLCTLAVVEALAALPQSWETDPLELDVPSGLAPEVVRAVERAIPR